ncbi:MAG TPA: spore germination protein [Bacillota bacterium]|nr:spore germination protein [Bacillota bacterium]
MAGNEDQAKISRKIEENLEYLKERLQLGESNFDVILKEITIGGKKAALLFLDGFTNSQISSFILRAVLNVKREEITPAPLEKLLRQIIPFVEVTPINDLEEAIREALAGPMILFLDGERQALVIDTREYPVRSPEEPDIEKVTRGSRDGFVETLVYNIALIRRRIRDPQLRVEAIKAGQRSVTDVAILYLNDVARPEIVDQVRKRIKSINIDALPMAEKSVEEFIAGSYWNPFPEVRYTERPDVAAAHLVEGHVVIIVDTSPSVMIAPVTFFHHLQHAEEFRHSAIIGTYIRWVRMLGFLLSFLLIPVWILLAEEPRYLPEFLSFIGPKEQAAIPLYLQFIIAHFGLDLVRMASIHTPSPFATALGLVGALLIGQIAVEVGFFVPEVLLYTGLVALGIFATPSWELSMANRVVLLLLILSTGIFGLPGLLGGLAVLVLRIGTTRSFGFPYLWPLIPFNAKALLSIVVRRPIPVSRIRPSFLKVKDVDRMQNKP